MKISRNAPCPCGSGKKYKQCCIGGEQATIAGNIRDELGEAIINQAQAMGVTDIDELNVIAQQLSTQRNQAPNDDFLGLSPAQMSSLLYRPFEAVDVVTFNEGFSPHCRVLTLFDQMIDGIGEQGVKATGKGNLPLKLCKTLYERDEGDLWPPIGSIRSEEDFDALHCVRLVAERARLIKRQKGMFSLTAKGKQLTQPTQRGALFFTLVQNYTRELNWAYRDNYPQIDIIQTGVMFSLYLLFCCGSTYRPTSFYEQLFCQAFPMITDDIEECAYSSIQAQAARCYTLRTFERFAYFFGLIEIEKTPDQTRVMSYRVKASPMLGEFIQFRC